jgi:hypothetical protein
LYHKFRDATNFEKTLDLGTNRLGLDLDLGPRFGFDFGFVVWIWFIKTKSTFKGCKSTNATKLQTVYTMNPYITNPNPNPSSNLKSQGFGFVASLHKLPFIFS